MSGLDGRIVIFDLDGTVCLGDGPVLAYGEAIAERATDAAAASLRDAVTRYLAGERVPGLEDAEDGYMAAWMTARSLGLPIEEVSAAYRAARAALAAHPDGIHAPPGFAEFAADLREAGATLLLVTNAPAAGLSEILAALEVGDCFDVVHGDAGKPDGLGVLLDGLSAAGTTVSRDTVLSVGDIWENDLRVPRERGAATALVDARARGRGTPDVRATSLVELYGWMRGWAQGRLDRPAR